MTDERPPTDLAGYSGPGHDATPDPAPSPMRASTGALIADAIALHPTPGVPLAHGTEAFLLSAGAGLDVFGLRTWELPDAIRASVIADYPRTGFRGEFAGLWRTEARRVPHGRAWFLRRYAVSDVTIRIAPFRTSARSQSQSASQGESTG